MKKNFLVYALIMLIAGCNSDSSTQNKTDSSAVAKPASSNSKIKNDIQLKENGLKVSQAFLLFDDGSRVPEDNTVQINQRVSLRLIVDGWSNAEGKVFPGASEKIITSDGNAIVDEADLFEAYSAAGVDKKDAEYLTLYAEITQLDKLYDYFSVEFRVWDKKSNAEVTGSYKLYIK